MIGFRVDVGLYNVADQFDPLELTNLSQIEFLDFNSLWSIGTELQPIGGNRFFSKLYKQGDSYDAINDVVNTLGEDFYTTWCTRMNGIPPVSEYDLKIHPEQFITTIYDAYPNTNNKLSNTYSQPGYYAPCVHIKSLKRLMVCARNYDSWILYRVNSDNTLTILNDASYSSYYPPSGLLATKTGTSVDDSSVVCFKFICTGYEKISDLWDGSKFITVKIGFNLGDKDRTYLREFSSHGGTSRSVDYLKALFSDNGTPIVNAPDQEGIVPPPNPYEPIPPSGPSDVSGAFDNTSDPIPDSSLPTLSAANTGFTRIYNPTLSQVQDLARYLWTDDTVLETIWNKIRQYFENPMEAIIGFNLVPVAVPNGGTKNFALMYIDTGIQMTAAASQFVDQDCGTVKLERYYGSALDQSPYTKVSCFLPYIGMVQLNTDEVMGATLQVKYRVDIVTGSCVAKIFVDGNVLYQYSGHCAINIPFAASDFSSYIHAAITVATLGLGAALGGAAGAAGAFAGGVGNAAQETNYTVTNVIDTTTTERNPLTGRQITSGTVHQVQTTEYPIERSSTKASFAGLSPANISNTVGQIMSSKPTIAHSGSFSGNSGYLGVRRPYLIIERPNMCLPNNYQKMNGYPSMITMTLGNCTGYTRVQQVQLTGMTATNPEEAEILSLLKSGVIF